MSRTLVFGLSGQIGAALAPALVARVGPVLAVSRQRQDARPGIEWQQGTLETVDAVPAEVARILSLGPLDSFAAWVEHVQPRVERIVAVGSTGRVDKFGSPDPRDRDEAQRLVNAEERLFAASRRLAIELTVLRPTLLYGSGRDRSLTRLAEFARRWRLLPLPASATGLRQPVHVEDVADAVLRSLDAPATFGRGFDLPGGEALPFDAMVRRSLARHAPGARVLRIPTPLFRIGIAVARLGGRAAAAAGWLWRVSQDQVSDPADADAAFGYRPRGFEP